MSAESPVPLYLGRARLLFLCAAGLFAAWEAGALLLKLAGGPWLEPAYRGVHLIQMAMLIMAALMARAHVHAMEPLPGLDKTALDRTATLVPAGLALSLAGDFINSALVDLRFVLGEDISQTLLSIPFFALAHACYMAAFFALGGKSRGGRRFGAGTRAAITALVTAIIVFPLWHFLIPPEAPALVKVLTLFYAFVVTGMMASAFWVPLAWGKRGIAAALGGVLFWVSDGIIGYFLGRESWAYSNILIWTTYFTAQMLISTAPLIGAGRRPLADMGPDTSQENSSPL